MDAATRAERDRQHDRYLAGEEHGQKVAPVTERAPYWDRAKQKWIKVVQVTPSVVEHREVPNPVTGVHGQPPEGEQGKPRPRSVKHR